MAYFSSYVHYYVAIYIYLYKVYHTHRRAYKAMDMYILKNYYKMKSCDYTNQIKHITNTLEMVLCPSVIASFFYPSRETALLVLCSLWNFSLQLYQLCMHPSTMYYLILKNQVASTNLAVHRKATLLLLDETENITRTESPCHSLDSAFLKVFRSHFWRSQGHSQQ